MSCGRLDENDKGLGKKALESLENPDDLKLDFQINDFNIKYDPINGGFHCKYQVSFLLLLFNFLYIIAITYK